MGKTKVIKDYLIEQPTYSILNNESSDLRANDSWNSSNGVRNSHKNGGVLKMKRIYLIFVIPFNSFQL